MKHLPLITLIFALSTLTGCPAPNEPSNTETQEQPSSETPAKENTSSTLETNSNKLEAGKFGYTMDVDGVNVTVNDVLPLDGFDRQVADFLTLGDTPTLQLRMIPEKASPASYNCGEGADFRKIAFSYNGFVSDGDKAGSCRINVTSVGDVYEGTFSGTLYNASGKEMVITNGFFRNDGSQLK